MNTVSYALGGFFVLFPLILGIVVTFFPPKKISFIYGWWSQATMEDQESWDYGQKIFGRVLLACSFVCAAIFTALIFCFIAFFDEYFYLRIVFGFVFLIVDMAVTIITTETKTRRMKLKRVMTRMKESE